MEFGFIELKLHYSEAKNHAGGEAVATNNAISAGSRICPRRRSKAAELSGDFLRQCSLQGDGGLDVSFLVGGYKFYAHRAVLAAGSPVFHDRLLGPTTAAASMDGITLHGVEAETFRVLLWFMYADALPGDDDEFEGASTAEMLRRLVAAADIYGVEKLKLACAQRLCEHVSVETVVEMLGLAETHKCPELKKTCMDFLMEENNLRMVALSQGYHQLLRSFPLILDELRAWLFPELESSDYEDFDLFF